MLDKKNCKNLDPGINYLKKNNCNCTGTSTRRSVREARWVGVRRSNTADCRRLVMGPRAEVTTFRIHTHSVCAGAPHYVFVMGLNFWLKLWIEPQTNCFYWLTNVFMSGYGPSSSISYRFVLWCRIIYCMYVMILIYFYNENVILTAVMYFFILNVNSF